MKLSKKDVITYAIVAVIFAALFSITLINGYRIQEELVWDEKQQEMGQIADKINSDLQILLQSYMALTEEAAGVVVEAGFSSGDEYIDYFQRFVADNETADAAYIAFDDKVSYFDDWTPTDSYDPTVRGWYKKGKAGGGAVILSDPYIDVITGNLVVSSAKMVKLQDGMIGVVSIDISLDDLKSLVDATHPTPNSSAYLLGPDAMFITHRDPDLLPRDVNGEEVFSKRGELAIEEIEVSKVNDDIIKIIDYDGVEKYNYMAELPAVPDWALGLAIPVEDFAGDVRARIGSLLPFVMLGVIVAAFFAVMAVIFIRDTRRKSYWYMSILDAIPMPLSVTDVNMNWTFINKKVEQMLNVKRSDVIGKHCSNWNANICKTDKCGINCLKNDKHETFFEQMGMDFQVGVSYLRDARGKKAGHIEIVQEITKLIKTQRDQTELLENISGVSHTFISGSKQIIQNTQTLAQSGMEQSAAVEQLLSSVSNIAEKTKHNAEMAGEAAKLAETIKTNAEKGSRQMDQMMEAVRDINAASQSINKVIKVIDDIAFQTNILALNAAVEAARAGQHGKGFAVVAEEVRNLAAKSAESAKDTGSLIANSVEKADLGSRIASETAMSLADIVMGINESNKIVNDIASSSEEQSVGIGQVNDGIGRMAQIVQENNATAEESAAAGAEMSDQADKLEMLISQFKTSDGGTLH